MRNHLYKSTICLLILFSWGQVQGQGECTKRVTDAAEQLKAGYFLSARDSLDAVSSCILDGSHSGADLELYYILLAKANFFLDYDEECGKALKEVLRINPDYSPDITDIPARFLVIINDLKAGKDPFAVDVYVTKHKQNSDIAPSVITVYTRAQIEELGARNLMDLIRITPGFMEMGDKNERNLGTRGLYGTTVQHLLFLLNGHKLTDLFTSSTGPDWISLDYVEQVEIIRGPGSALYGGNAMSGVVNIVTRDGGSFNGTSVSTSLGNGNTGKINLQLGGGTNRGYKFYFSASAGFSNGFAVESDTMRDLEERFPATNPTVIIPAAGGTEWVNRYYPGYNILSIFSMNKLKVTANAQRSSLAYLRPFKSYNLGGIEVDSSRSARRTDSREYVQAEYNVLPESKSTEWTIKGSFDHFKKDDFQPFNSLKAVPAPGRSNRILGDEVRGVFESQLSSDKVGLGKNKYTILGTEFIYYDQFYNWYFDNLDGDTSLGIQTNTGNFFVIRDSNGRAIEQPTEANVSIYAQSEGFFFHDKIGITAGIRGDYHFVFGEAISPRFALVYLKNEKLKVKLLINRAFLPPPFLYRYDNPSFKGKEDIEPQYITSAEAAVFGTFDKKLSYKVNAYYNKVTQFIRQKQGSDQYDNDGTLKLFGFESSLRFIGSTSAIHYSAFANSSITRDLGSDAQFLDSMSHRLNNWPAFSVNAGGGFRFKTLGAFQNAGVNASCNLWGKTPFPIKEEIRDLSPNPEYKEQGYQIPTQFTLHLNLYANINQFTLGCSFHNLLNRRELLPGPTLIPRTGEPRSVYLTVGLHLK